MLISSEASASGFMLWEQDAASLGNYHAGTAAIADDASTAWYNPAGMLRIKNQEAVFGGNMLLTSVRFSGTVTPNTLINPATLAPIAPAAASAQGGTFNFIPFLHYVAPITERVAIGMSIDMPYDIKTNYGTSSFARYAATLTTLQVVDYTPSIAVKFTDRFSVGAGFDAQRFSTEVDQIITAGALGGPMFDTKSQSRASDWAYGYRLGAFMEFTPNTRVGINYHSKVTHHAIGNSYFTGPLAAGGSQYANNFFTNITLPATTSLSLFQTWNTCWDVMGTLSYTQWSVFKNWVLQNVAGIQGGINTNNETVYINNYYHNAWNFAVGANYHPSEKWILRTGLGYDQTPTNNAYRNLPIPDSNRIAIALGAHFQAIPTIGFDVGWTHYFLVNANINNVQQRFGDQVTTTNGSLNSSADVYGLSMKWDMV